MGYLRFASIDIGSNAIRLLCSYVFETEFGPFFRKGLLVRMPVRLGEDAFQHARIGDDKKHKLALSLRAFNDIMEAHEIMAFKAYATSAMRDAVNRDEVVDYVEKFSGIKIEIISGEEEANVISSKFIPEFVKEKSRILYVDVGGGSTELTYVTKKEKVYQQSFNIGTIRYLYDQVTQGEWNNLREWITSKKLDKSKVTLIGSGGNINKIFKIKRRLPDDLHITDTSLREFYAEAKALTYRERMIKYQLNPDRADVIVPATDIFLHIINQTNTRKIYVPKSGLSDGIIRNLYKEYKAS